ncbi:allantoate amidohydrolase [Actinoplanes teichomyceticus]|uniref:N-carbamoyl-L-amino-acid hydrolase n=1 Tax=Actinoplanes teichomyceticus TaxID=1867 RepID=A0A561VGK9_ACTTI|nr:allantoate amidohydrolase [Actinoplanes teichomyceticus]TWG10743.1 N-carbamoyl-L-amino-acid hydrolase [Actinoplanes teichomyceticus]GIF12633.1 Zn-dependent hydrolase [Actinoplanes teichomyceticus]
MSDFAALWAEIAPIGRTRGGGYLRYALTPPELALRDWFRAQADRRGMTVTGDGNGNLFAWCGAPWAPGTVLTGSHFDAVPHGGGYDGPLGIVSAFLALDRMSAPRGIAIAAFVDEEGGRFGVPCLGSRLLTGAITPERAAALTDRDGVTFGTALGAAPTGRVAALGGLAAFVELHIEQGRALAAPVGVASAIWPHGRWRMEFTGVGDHAGTTRMTDRRDPMLTFAHTVLAANREARLAGAHATMGRIEAEPNATNAIPSLVRGWLDARAADTATLDRLLEAVLKEATERAGLDGTEVSVVAESVTAEVAFDTELARRLSALLGDAPILPTGAGHDAGVLSAHLPTAMLFVRNPTGVSHAPAENATDADCEAGVAALARVLESLT